MQKFLKMQIKSFKIKNPYRLDQEIKQEVSISEDIVYDYTTSPWISVDTEYLSFNHLQDKLCVIQIASKEKAESETQRVELIYVYEKQPTPKLIDLFQNRNIEKLFHVFSADMPRIEKFIGVEIMGKIFDTKVAARIAWTNSQEHGMNKLIKMFINPFHTQQNGEELDDWEIGPENWSNEQIFYMMQDVVYLDALRQRILQMAERRGTTDLILQAMTAIPTITQLYKKGYTERIFGY